MTCQTKAEDGGTSSGQVKEGQGQGQGQGLRLLIAASCKKYFDVTVIFASYKYVRGMVACL